MYEDPQVLAMLSLGLVAFFLTVIGVRVPQ
jgi:hypothetical protein